jgi:hypothetical protein
MVIAALICAAPITTAESYLQNSRNPLSIAYNSQMPAENKLTDEAFLEMRWRCLSLAADLDRMDRAGASDVRLEKLREAIGVLLEHRSNRAERVQLIFTDHTPPPAYGKKV